MIAAGTAPPNFRGKHNLHISISNKTRAASDRNMTSNLILIYLIEVWLPNLLARFNLFILLAN